MNRLKREEAGKVKIGERTFRMYRLPEISDKTYMYTYCDAKLLAEELNSMFGEPAPSETFSYISESTKFIRTIVNREVYSMKDGSLLIWSEGMGQWGFVFPTWVAVHATLNSKAPSLIT